LALKKVYLSFRRRAINAYVTLSLLTLAIILQTTLSRYLNINDIHPNLVLVLVLSCSLLKGWQPAILLALAGGVFLDLLSGVRLGTFTISLMITALLTTFWQTRYFANMTLPILLAFPYSLLFNLLILISLRLSGYSVAWLEILRTIVVPESLLNVLVMALIYPLLIWFNNQRQKGELRI
jgi:rod shape-determining protein MreD